MIVSSLALKQPKVHQKYLWSDDDRRTLLKANGELTIEELAKKVGRPIESTRRQCQKLGIKYKKVKRK